MTDDPTRPSTGEGSAFRVSSRGTAPADRGAGDRAVAGRGRPGLPANLPAVEELAAFLVTALAILIAAAVSDEIDAGLAWTLITALAFAFILSRGLAKR